MDIQEIVDRTCKLCAAAHRGAFWWKEPDRIAVAYGNHGFATDQRY